MKKLLLILLVFAGMVTTASADDFLKGSFDSWGDGVKFNNDNQASVELTSGTDIEYKIVLNGTWYGAQNQGATMFWNNCTNWIFSSIGGGQNCHLQVCVTGTYTFTIDKTDGLKVTVTYPAYSTNEVYFCNNLSFSTPYTYILKGSNWDDDKGSGSKDQPNGIAMTQIGTTNIWKAEYPVGANKGYVAFVNAEQNNYDNFWATKAVYRADLSTSTPLFVSTAVNSGDKNSTQYFNNGEWHAYPTYSRAVTSGNFGTICLPFAATVTGATVYEITGKVVDGGSNVTGINLSEVAGTLTAGKAYIFKATGTTLTATYSGSYTAALTDQDMQGNLSSTPLSVTADADNYIVKDNQIRQVVSGGSGVTVGQYKGYIKMSSVSVAAAPGLNFMGLFDDVVTGIEDTRLNNTAETNNVVYNLAGQRVATPAKGLYIVNGKKVIIK